MNRWARAALWGAGVLLALAGAVSLAVRLLVTEERIRSWLVAPMESRLGRRVTLQRAAAGLRGLSLEGLEVAGPAGGEPLLKAASVSARWRLLPLLWGRLEVADFRVRQPRITLVRDREGRLEAADILSGAGSRAEPAAGGGAPVELLVLLVSARDGRLVYEDRSREPVLKVVLEEMDSELRDLAPGRPLSWEISAAVKAPLAARLSARGTASPAAGDFRVELALEEAVLPGGGLAGDLEASLVARGGREIAARGVARLESPAREGRKEERAAVAFDLSADLPAGTADIGSLDLDLGGRKLHAEGRLTSLREAPRLAFKADSADFDLGALAAFMAPLASLGGEGAGAPEGAPARKAPRPLEAAGEVRVGSLGTPAGRLQDFRASVKLDGRGLALEQVAGRLWDGTLGAEARARLGEPGPHFELSARLEGARVESVLGELRPSLGGVMTGSLRVAGRGSGRGRDPGAVTAEVDALAEHGRIRNLELLSSLAKLLRSREMEELEFRRLSLQAGARSGVAEVRALELDGPLVRARGRGTVALAGGGLDMVLAVAVPRELAARVLKDRDALDVLTGMDGWTSLPLKLGGTLKDPVWGLEAEAVAGKVAEYLARKAAKSGKSGVLKELLDFLAR